MEPVCKVRRGASLVHRSSAHVILSEVLYSLAQGPWSSQHTGFNRSSPGAAYGIRRLRSYLTNIGRNRLFGLLTPGGGGNAVSTLKLDCERKSGPRDIATQVKTGRTKLKPPAREMLNSLSVVPTSPKGASGRVR